MPPQQHEPAVLELPASPSPPPQDFDGRQRPVSPGTKKWAVDYWTSVYIENERNPVVLRVAKDAYPFLTLETLHNHADKLGNKTAFDFSGEEFGAAASMDDDSSSVISDISSVGPEDKMTSSNDDAELQLQKRKKAALIEIMGRYTVAKVCSTGIRLRRGKFKEIHDAVMRDFGLVGFEISFSTVKALMRKRARGPPKRRGIPSQYAEFDHIVCNFLMMLHEESPNRRWSSREVVDIANDALRTCLAQPKFAEFLERNKSATSWVFNYSWFHGFMRRQKGILRTGEGYKVEFVEGYLEDCRRFLKEEEEEAKPE